MCVKGQGGGLIHQVLQVSARVQTDGQCMCESVRESVCVCVCVCACVCAARIAATAIRFCRLVRGVGVQPTSRQPASQPGPSAITHSPSPGCISHPPTQPTHTHTLPYTHRHTHERACTHPAPAPHSPVKPGVRRAIFSRSTSLPRDLPRACTYKQTQRQCLHDDDDQHMPCVRVCKCVSGSSPGLRPCPKTCHMHAPVCATVGMCVGCVRLMQYMCMQMKYRKSHTHTHTHTHSINSMFGAGWMKRSAPSGSPRGPARPACPQ